MKHESGHSMGAESIDTPHLSWSDFDWIDPDGGIIRLHSTIPTVVFPREMRPKEHWDGLALLTPSSEIDAWEDEESAEKESKGVNLTRAKLSGGNFGKYLEGLEMLSEISFGKFPDPEPRRLHRLAEKSEKRVWFIEPELTDEEWYSWSEKQADEYTRPTKLIKQLWAGKRFKKYIKQSKSLVKIPEDGSSEFASAAALAYAWWSSLEFDNGIELSNQRDLRFAKRLRGALKELREMGHIENEDTSHVVLLVPHYQAWRPGLLKALDMCPEPEHIVEEEEE